MWELGSPATLKVRPPLWAWLGHICSSVTIHAKHRGPGWHERPGGAAVSTAYLPVCNTEVTAWPSHLSSGPGSAAHYPPPASSHRGWRVAEGRLPPAGPSEKQLSFLGSRLCAVPKRQRPGDKQNSGQLQLPPPGPWLQGSVCGCPAGPRAACVQEVPSVGVFE